MCLNSSHCQLHILNTIHDSCCIDYFLIVYLSEAPQVVAGIYPYTLYVFMTTIVLLARYYLFLSLSLSLCLPLSLSLSIYFSFSLSISLLFIYFSLSHFLFVCLSISVCLSLSLCLSLSHYGIFT